VAIQRFSSRSLVDTYWYSDVGVGFVVNGFTIHPAMSLPFSLQGPREAWPEGYRLDSNLTVDWAFNFGPMRAGERLDTPGACSTGFAEACRDRHGRRPVRDAGAVAQLFGPVVSPAVRVPDSRHPKVDAPPALTVAKRRSPATAIGVALFRNEPFPSCPHPFEAPAVGDRAVVTPHEEVCS